MKRKKYFKKKLDKDKNGCTFVPDKHENTQHHYRNFKCDWQEDSRNGNGIDVSDKEFESHSRKGMAFLF